ncbi:DUF72 domain-containing protein [Pinibacter aurantiacus]|uniref:DUF72 domain-containing protein n=1 Tax=Pinibacter aurantiacus TaxID=2851599 RepID=A0A9E2WA10_9BACT|nr:DUF72 domain-containing protein [Pinibacter aurantiacus]MBV4360632.1 DUF72 domain-containing protein [Pinibacter aurantiacus]
MKSKSNKDLQFYCGTSNIVLPVANKAFFPQAYQAKTRLHYYASMLNSVETNSTFYKLPMLRTVEKWANDVPSTFRFTLKLSKSVTHAKELHYEAADVNRFMDAADMVGNKKGCILVQFPASISVAYSQKVRRLLDVIHSTGKLKGWHLAIEFRDKSWYHDKVYTMLENYKAVVVMHDMPKSHTPTIDMAKSFVYLRFHGEKGDYRGGYADDFLREHAMTIREWLEKKIPVFAYFNNTIGAAIHNALTLDKYVRAL